MVSIDPFYPGGEWGSIWSIFFLLLLQWPSGHPAETHGRQKLFFSSHLNSIISKSLQVAWLFRCIYIDWNGEFNQQIQNIKYTAETDAEN